MINNKFAKIVSRVWWMVLGISVLLAMTNITQAQSKKKEIPPRKVVTTITKDKVEIRADFYAGTHEKESAPVILVHDWDGNRTDLEELALFLQKNHGCAVIVPDLRGHGDSLTVQNVEKQLDHKRFRKGDFETIGNDVDACRKFLQNKNDLGELNIDMLTVIGVGKMSPIVVGWCIDDWQWPALGGIKQGQNVKAIVLISPVRRFKGFSMNFNLQSPLFSGDSNDPLAAMLVWGKRNSASAKEGREIFEAMNKRRGATKAKSGTDTWWREKTLFSAPYSTSLKGLDLLKEKQSQLFPVIGSFIEHKIIDRKDDFRWQNRSRK